MASHDANLIREVGGDCYVLFDGSLRRIQGIDSYLRIFAKYHHKA
jgi:ABC-type polysaccharide/polyol phosphate transport system ATPase subunit